MVLLSRRVDYSGFWRAWMEFPMFSTWRWTLGNFVSSTGNFITITLVHMKKVINKVIVRDFGDFDNEIDFARQARKSLQQAFVLSSSQHESPAGVL